MTYLRNVWRAMTAVAVVLAVSASAKADITLDDFSVPAVAEIQTLSGAGSSGFAPIGIPGGIRTVEFSIAQSAFPVTPSATVSIGNGLLNADVGNGAVATLTVGYTFDMALDFIPNVPAGGTPGDLLFSGFSQNSILVPGNPAASDQPSTFTLTISTIDSTLTTSGTLSNALTTQAIALTSLTGGSLDDLSSVTGLSLTVSAGAGADFAIDSLSVTTPEAPDNNPIPAPPAVLLALAAVPALGLRRLRRKTA